MLTGTTETAIRALILLALKDEQSSLTPRAIAAALKTSPTYTSKVLSSLVKAGLLVSRKGARGGVQLARRPKEISLLDIVSAAQGPVLADYCQEVPDHRLRHTCAYHRAMAELHRAMVRVLSKWTLADLVAEPCPARAARLVRRCLMSIAPERLNSLGGAP